MSTTEIKVGGFGGQGVILAGIIIGKAAAIYDRKFATMTQSYGPEARGSACSAQVIISDEKILYPYVTAPQILMAMSQDAFQTYHPEVTDGGLVIIEESLVKPEGLRPGVRLFSVPAARIAEEIGRTMVLNIIMVGFFIAVTKVLSTKAARESVKSLVPKGTETLNLLAYERGFTHGLTWGKGS